MMLKLLLIEDNDSFAFGLTLNLEVEGFTVLRASTGAVGLQMAMTDQVDIIILDILLPDRSGFDVLKALRSSGYRTPIIVLSGLQEESDRVLAFRLGADDYVMKPFHLMELIERIKARARYVEAATISKSIDFGPARLAVDAKRIRLGSAEIDLRPKELMLLACLMKARGAIVSKADLFQAAWSSRLSGETRTFDQHMRLLRKKLQRFGYGWFIRTVHGEGYAVQASAPDTNLHM